MTAMYELHAESAPAAAAELAQLRSEVEHAYDALVNAVLDLKQGTVDALETRIVGLEQLRQPFIETRERIDQALHQLELDRTLRSLAETSRWHATDRRVVFVGRDYFGDNLKYAWLHAQEQAARRGFECWYLPFDHAQEGVVRGLGASCFPADPAAWTPDHVSLALGAGVAVICDTFFSAG